MSKKKQKEKRGNIPEKLGDWAGLLKELSEGNDRSSAIVGAAFVDEHLRQLLASFMIDEEHSVDELLGTGISETPLSSFGPRITAAYCLGLITRSQRDDLRRIKLIRNEFAHSLHGCSFENEEIKKKCASLEIVNTHLTQPLTSRRCYELATCLLSSYIDIQGRKISEMRRGVPDSWDDVGQAGKVNSIDEAN